MTAAIELVDVVKDFPVARSVAQMLRHPLTPERKRALHGVSLSVAPGEVLAMLGPNGGGKSTCLQLLAGLVTPTSGTARIHGIDASRAPVDARTALGFVSASDRGFYGRLDVRENLRFFAALHGFHGADFRRRGDELAEMLEFADLWTQRFQLLSAGQRARVALARALLHRPSVLLIDEATRALDPGSARRFRRRVVDDLAGRQGIAVLYTTHDLAEARDVASRIIVLDRGRVVGQGTWEQVQPALNTTFFPEDDA